MPEASLGATPVEEPDGYALPADSTRNFRGHWPLVTAKELLDATRDALADAKASKRGLDRILVVHGAQDHVVPLSNERRSSRSMKPWSSHEYLRASINASSDDGVRKSDGILKQP